MTPEISKKALKRILKEEIKPEAEWQFILRRSLVWIGIALTAGIGAWALSMALFPILSLGIDLPRGGWPRFFLPLFLRPLPIIWTSFVVVFISIAVIEFRKVGRGYRHRVVVIALSILALVITLSGVFHALHVNEMSERGFRKNLPPYEAFSVAPEDFWLRAEEGFLMGTIISKESGGFILEDSDGTTWNIVVTSETAVRPGSHIEAGEDIKIVGEKAEEHLFEAHEILPGTRPLFRGNASRTPLHNNHGSPKPDIGSDRIRMR